MANKRWIFSVIEVHEAAVLGNLVDVLSTAIDNLTPPGSLDLTQVYLVTNPQKRRVVQCLEENSLPYHEFVVGELGERCRRIDCIEHPKTNVVRINDRQ